MAVNKEYPIKESTRTEEAVKANVFLQPIAAPSILGLFGFAGATLMVGAHMAGWFGGANATLYLLPFAVFFGGLAQFLAGMWAFKARDGLATAMHGMWGSFWMSYGLLHLLAARGTITLPAGAFPEMGWWFIVLAWITFMGAIASLAVNLGLFLVLGSLTAASIIAAVGTYIGNGAVTAAAGWVFVWSAIVAWYTASALMMEGTFQRSILPLGKKLGDRIGRERPEVSIGAGEPGVMHGQ